MILDDGQQMTHKKQQKVGEEEHEGRVGQILALAKLFDFGHAAELREQSVILVLFDVFSAQVEIHQ